MPCREEGKSGSGSEIWGKNVGMIAGVNRLTNNIAKRVLYKEDATTVDLFTNPGSEGDVKEVYIPLLQEIARGLALAGDGETYKLVIPTKVKRDGLKNAADEATKKELAKKNVIVEFKNDKDFNTKFTTKEAVVTVYNDPACYSDPDFPKEVYKPNSENGTSGSYSIDIPVEMEMGLYTYQGGAEVGSSGECIGFTADPVKDRKGAAVQSGARKTAGGEDAYNYGVWSDGESVLRVQDVIISSIARWSIAGTVEDGSGEEKPNWIANELYKMISGFDGMIGMENVEDIILNDGVRRYGDENNDTTEKGSKWVAGIYPASWTELIEIFRYIVLVMSVIFSTIIMARILLLMSLDSMNVAKRFQLKEELLKFVLVGFGMLFLNLFIGMMMQLNYTIVQTMSGVLLGSMDKTEVNLFASGLGTKAGDVGFGTLVSYIIMLGAKGYINVVYVHRAIMVAILIILGPFFVVGIGLGREKNFMNYINELVGCIFMQSFHSIVIVCILMAQRLSSSNGSEQNRFFSLVLVFSLIPITSSFRKLVFGDSSLLKDGESIAESMGNKFRSQATAGAGAVVGLGASAVGAVGAVGISAAGVGLADKGGKFISDLKNGNNSSHSSGVDVVGGSESGAEKSTDKKETVDKTKSKETSGKQIIKGTKAIMKGVGMVSKGTFAVARGDVKGAFSAGANIGAASIGVIGASIKGVGEEKNPVYGTDKEGKQINKGTKAIMKGTNMVSKGAFAVARGNAKGAFSAGANIGAAGIRAIGTSIKGVGEEENPDHRGR